MVNNFAGGRRPRVFPLHRDLHQYYPDFGMLDEIVEMTKAKQIEAVDAAMGKNWIIQPARRLYRRHKAQWNDAIVVFGILDAFVRAQRGIFIRAPYLLLQMQHDYPGYHWQPSVIGRVLSAVIRVCQASYSEFSERQAPLAAARDERSKYYVVDPTGGEEGCLWLLRCLKVLALRIDDIMTRESAGDFTGTIAEGPQPFPVYSQWFGNLRIRDADGYRAQMRLDARLPVSKGRKDELNAYDPFA